MNMRMANFSIMALFAVLLSQCSLRTMAIREVTDIVQAGVPAFERDDDLELIKQAMPANIKLLEAMLESDPENIQLLALLSQMYGSYTFGFVDPLLDEPDLQQEDLIRARVNRLLSRGVAYGEKALSLAEKACEKSIKVATEVDNCFNALSREDVPALFWYGFNLAAYINRNLDSVAALGQGVFVEKAMQRIIALHEDYMFGSAHLLLMAYYGSRSSMMGGSADKAKQHYDRIQTLNQKKFILADVYYARFALVQQNNKAEFEKLLRPLLKQATVAGEPSTLRLYNELAKNRAELYLKSIDDLF
jgi:hypothetical protein